MGQKSGLPQLPCIFIFLKSMLLKYFKESDIQHDTSWLMFKLYFKIILSNPNFCALVPLITWSQKQLSCTPLWLVNLISQQYDTAFKQTHRMHYSVNSQTPPNLVDFLRFCEGVYHKQEVCFLLCFLGQIVTWQYNPNLLDYNWPWTVINDHDWQLRIYPYCNIQCRPQDKSLHDLVRRSS